MFKKKKRCIVEEDIQTVCLEFIVLTCPKVCCTQRHSNCGFGVYIHSINKPILSSFEYLLTVLCQVLYWVLKISRWVRNVSALSVISIMRGDQRQAWKQLLLQCDKCYNLTTSGWDVRRKGRSALCSAFLCFAPRSCCRVISSCVWREMWRLAWTCVCESGWAGQGACMGAS